MLNLSTLQDMFKYYGNISESAKKELLQAMESKTASEKQKEKDEHEAMLLKRK
jgi:hypothetical protein